MGPSSVTVEQEGAMSGRAPLFTAPSFMAPVTQELRAAAVKRHCARPGFPGLATKGGGAQSTEGAFCHWQFAMGERE